MTYILFCVCLCFHFCLQGRGDIQPQLDSAMQDVSDKYILLEETEKQALRKALIEDRQRFCCFVAMLRPVVVSTAGKKERNEPKLLREQQKVILLHYVHIVLIPQTGKIKKNVFYFTA